MTGQALTRPRTPGRAARGAHAAVSGALAAVAARGAYTVLRRYPPAGEKTWARANHRGEPVTLLEGPAVAAGAITVEVLAAAIAAPLPAAPARAAIALAGAGALGFGVVDDLAGSGARRGLRGHLGALAHGEVTTGTVKLAGLAATGLGCALLASRAGAPGPRRPAAADVIINAGLIAGGANLLNLFDLRPGRAIKVAALSAGLIAAVSATGLAGVAEPCGAALGLLPEDLRERAMLGDAGANALGAMLGAAAATSLPRPARAGLLTGIAALTLASEKVSFTRIIERTPPLRWLDTLGRRPPLPVPLPAARTPPAAELACRRPAGRHRRDRTGVSRARSGDWFADFLKRPARQEP